MRPTLGCSLLLSIDLHSYYTQVESLLERVLATLEGQAPAGPTAHTELLRRSLRPLEGVRPAILAAGHAAALDELRRFRHFFRHAYALDLRADKLRRVLEPCPGLHAGIIKDLDAFDAFLGRLIEEIARSG